MPMIRSTSGAGTARYLRLDPLATGEEDISQGGGEHIHMPPAGTCSWERTAHVRHWDTREGSDVRYSMVQYALQHGASFASHDVRL